MSPVAPAVAFLAGIGFGEMLVIAFVSVLVFGDKLPDVLRNAGRTYARFRRSVTDVSRPLRDEIQRITTLPPELRQPLLPFATRRPKQVPQVYDVAPVDVPPPAAASPPPPPPSHASPWPGPATTPPAADPFDEPPPV